MVEELMGFDLIVVEVAVSVVPLYSEEVAWFDGVFKPDAFLRLFA